MGETIDWGIPNSGRTRKTEKYDTPVVTMSAILKDGAGRKFSFNNAAIEALGLVKPTNDEVSYVAFGFSGDDLYCKSTSVESNDVFKTNKSFSFSDKKMFEYIAKRKELTVSCENNLFLEEVEGDHGQDVMGMFKVVNTVSGDAPVVPTEDTEEDIPTMPTPDTEEGTGNEVFSAAGEDTEVEEVEEVVEIEEEVESSDEDAW